MTKSLWNIRRCLKDECQLHSKDLSLFPLGRILRAERHFPPKLCSNKVENSSTFQSHGNIASRAKFRLVENGLIQIVI